MNNKVIIGIAVLVVVGGGILLIMNQSGKMQMQKPSATSQVQPTSKAGVSPAMAKNAVTIQNFAFSPATLTVKAGDKVTWTNQDAMGHSATADDSSFDTGVIAQGQTGSVTFSKPGTYTYHCSVHPYMKATIIVTQ